MAKMIMAQENGKAIGGADKIFGVSSLAKARIKMEACFTPGGKGIRIAICAISEEKCKMIPEKMVAAMKVCGC